MPLLDEEAGRLGGAAADLADHQHLALGRDLGDALARSSPIGMCTEPSMRPWCPLDRLAYVEHDEAVGQRDRDLVDR